MERIWIFQGGRFGNIIKIKQDQIIYMTIKYNLYYVLSDNRTNVIIRERREKGRRPTYIFGVIDKFKDTSHETTMGPSVVP